VCLCANRSKVCLFANRSRCVGVRRGSVARGALVLPHWKCRRSGCAAVGTTIMCGAGRKGRDATWKRRVLTDPPPLVGTAGGWQGQRGTWGDRQIERSADYLTGVQLVRAAAGRVAGRVVTAHCFITCVRHRRQQLTEEREYSGHYGMVYCCSCKKMERRVAGYTSTCPMQRQFVQVFVPDRLAPPPPLPAQPGP
jgi:hypothetical protein